MRTSRRIVIGVAVSGLVAAGGVTFGLIANANTQAFCDGSGTPVTCTIPTQTITSPSEIQVNVTLESGKAQTVTVTWSGECSLSGQETPIASGTPAAATPITTAVSIVVPLPYATPDSCDITTTATLSTTGTFLMALDWTPSSSSSSSSSAPPPPTRHVSTVSGYGGKCVDDRGNSSSNRAEVIIWSCNSSDSAQGWTFSSGELKHNNKCANIQGNGGSGSKLILWSCTGASNEKWFHSSSDGEYVSAGTAHGLLCVDDPGYSKSNGTQLIVYKCHNSGNQHWSS